MYYTYYIILRINTVRIIWATNTASKPQPVACRVRDRARVALQTKRPDTHTDHRRRRRRAAARPARDCDGRSGTDHEARRCRHPREGDVHPCWHLCDSWRAALACDEFTPLLLMRGHNTGIIQVFRPARSLYYVLYVLYYIMYYIILCIVGPWSKSGIKKTGTLTPSGRFLEFRGGCRRPSSVS